jgi:hypothetical protein
VLYITFTLTVIITPLGYPQGIAAQVWPEKTPLTTTNGFDRAIYSPTPLAAEKIR